MIQRPRTGFTLFEVVLAIALSAVLLGLIGMAINLYLTRVSMSRDRVEEAQLARSILSMIADDLRATAIYQPQDVTDVAQLMAESASFDVDSIDDERSGGSGSGGSSGATSGTSSAGGASGSGSGGTSSGSSGGSGGSTGSAGSGSSGGGSSTSDNAANESEMPLGVNGGIADLYVDVERPPRGDELFATLTGFTNAPMVVPTNGLQSGAAGTSWGTMPSPSDLRTVRYFIRDGDRSDASGLAATTLAPQMQGSSGGLVRQEIPRPARLLAEQSANAAVLESGQALVAPEVVRIEFHYFDGEQTRDVWDMVEERALPLAIEVRIWLTSASEAAAGAAAYNANGVLSTAREYRQTVFLPMAPLSQSGGAMSASGSSAGSSAGSSPSNSSSSGSSSSSSSSSFGSGSTP